MSVVSRASNTDQQKIKVSSLCGVEKFKGRRVLECEDQGETKGGGGRAGEARKC